MRTDYISCPLDRPRPHPTPTPPHTLRNVKTISNKIKILNIYKKVISIITLNGKNKLTKSPDCTFDRDWGHGQAVLSSIQCSPLLFSVRLEI